MAEALAAAPAGTLTQAFTRSSEREGAYRLVENDRVEPKEIGRAALRACLERTKELPFFYVPIDGSSLTLTDRTRAKGLGRVGNRVVKSFGVEVMTAIGVAPDGVPLGYCAQQYWTRPDEPNRRSHKRRPLEQKETRYWMQAIAAVEAARESGTAIPWYQVDRGGDFRELIEWQASADAWVTIRANQNRRVAGRSKYLRSAMKKAKVLGHYDLPVAKGPQRSARVARIEVRATTVSLRLTDRCSERKTHESMQAVLAREVGTTPRGEEPIEWLLLTNHAAQTLAQARLVIGGYATRWRIEEFHRTWKTTCGVEQTQLRSALSVQRWAVTLAVVAMRIERMKRLARTTPDVPATEELKPIEVDALLALKHPDRFGTGYMPTIGEAVLWIAELGGYTGKSSGGPPGAVVIGRGLEKVQGAVWAVGNLRGAKKM
jgi:hypothetical protein